MSVSPEPPALDVSVIIPVYNEEETVPRYAGAIRPVLDALGKSYELLLVDDGSTDGTAAAMKALQSAWPQVRVVRFRRNAGQTAAFDAGFRAARGAVFVTLDGDLQNDPADIPKVLAGLSEADCVNGWRLKRQDSWLRRISSRVANGLRNRLTHESIRDVGCSLRAFRRECVARIKLYNGLHRFLPTLIRMEGFRIAEVPVNHFPRTAGRSKYGVWNRAFRALRDLFAVRWMMARQLRYEIEDEDRG